MTNKLFWTYNYATNSHSASWGWSTIARIIPVVISPTKCGYKVEYQDWSNKRPMGASITEVKALIEADWEARQNGKVAPLPKIQPAMTSEAPKLVWKEETNLARGAFTRSGLRVGFVMFSKETYRSLMLVDRDVKLADQMSLAAAKRALNKAWVAWWANAQMGAPPKTKGVK